MAFDALFTRPNKKASKWRGVTIGASLSAHGIVLLVGVAHSMWQVDEMPMPAVRVTLTAAAPPPPPPPPPPKKSSKKKTQTKRRQPKPDTLVQPEETPEPEPEEGGEESEDDGEEGGEEGGEVGGEVGGQVGGVVGSVGTAPPPPKKKGPEMLSANIGRKQLLSNPAANQPRIPPALRRQTFKTRVMVCASAAGNVTSVRVLQGSNPTVDGQLPGIIRGWRYKPYTINGKPVPFCYPFTYVLRQR